MGNAGETPPGMSLPDLLVKVGKVRRGVRGKGSHHHTEASNLNWVQLPTHPAACSGGTKRRISPSAAALFSTLAWK